jgi:Uma2 family endonuclease
MSGGTRNHNRIAFNFSKLLDDALVDRPCEVYIADVKVQVEPGQKYFYPDVVVTCDEHDNDPQLVQFPSLIIEVLSPSTEAADRGIKFAKYRQFSTLQARSRDISARATGAMGSLRVWFGRFLAT